MRVSMALIFSASLFISLLLIPVLIKHSAWLRLVDQPDGVRKIHTRTIPRSGGIAIGMAALTPLLFVYAHDTHFNIYFISAFIIIIFGLLDDRFNFSPRWKFFGQILALAIFSQCLPEAIKFPSMFPNDTGWALGWLGIFFFLLAATNAINLSDGLDGLAGGTVLLSLALLAYLSWQVDAQQEIIVALSMLGAIFGFLRYNTHPAIVFMGDAGSQFIGFMVATVSVLLTQSQENAYSALLPLFIVGLPFIDTLTVMAIRIKNKRSPFSPDKNHFHHQLMQFGLRHHEAVLVIYLAHVLFLGLGYSLRFSPDSIILLAYALTAAIVIGTFNYLKHINWQYRLSSSTIATDTPLNYTPPALEQNPNKKLNIASYGLGLSLCLFWISLIISHSTSTLTAWMAIALLMFYFGFKIISPNPRVNLNRVLGYGTCLVVVYYALDAPAYPMVKFAHALFIIMAIIALILSAMNTHRTLFKLDNQDILVWILLVTGYFIAHSLQLPNPSLHMFISLIIMFYCVEYIIAYSALNAFLSYICFASLFTIICHT